MNEKKEEKWTVNLRDDQCRFIADAMDYIVRHASKRIGNGTFDTFDQFSAAQVKAQATEIAALLAEVTS